MVPLGTLTIFAGDGGTGKSAMALSIAADLSNGLLSEQGDMDGPRRTLILSTEDDWSTVMVPRLKASQSNMDGILNLSVEIIEEDGFTYTKGFDLHDDLEDLRVTIEAEQIGLLILDPVVSFMRGDPNKSIDVRRSLDPLARLAQETGIAVIMLHHFNKGSGGVKGKLNGAATWRDAVRSYWGFARDEESGHRVMSQNKMNYSKADSASYGFDLIDTPVPVINPNTGEIEMQGYPAVGNLTSSEVSVDDILGRETDADGATGLDECSGWLEAYLNREPFEFLREDIMKHGRKEGFSDAMLKRAKQKLGVTHDRTKSVPSKTIWQYSPVG